MTIKCNNCGSVGELGNGFVKASYRSKKVNSIRMWFGQVKCKYCGTIFIPEGAIPLTNEEHRELTQRYKANRSKYAEDKSAKS